MAKSKEEMKVKTQIQSLVDEYDLQSKRPNERLKGSPPICSENQKLPKKVSTKKKDWDINLDLHVMIT